MKRFTTKILAITATTRFSPRFCSSLHTSQQSISTCKFVVLIFILNPFEACFLYQREKNLSFVWYILNEMNIRTPTLARIKAFKLPGLRQPVRVCITVCTNGVRYLSIFFYSTLVVMVCHFTAFLWLPSFNNVWGTLI